MKSSPFFYVYTLQHILQQCNPRFYFFLFQPCVSQQHRGFRPADRLQRSFMKAVKTYAFFLRFPDKGLLIRRFPGGEQYVKAGMLA